MFVVLDVDNTLADTSQREDRWSPDAAINDPVIKGVERVITRFQELKYDFLILTGRPEILRDATMRWLLEKLNLALPETHLLMRSTGNLLTAAESKREQFLSFRQSLENHHTCFLFIDADVDACANFAPFGITLQAPGCWPSILPSL